MSAGYALAKRQRLVWTDLHDSNRFGAQRFQETRLVLLATLRKPVQHRVGAHWPVKMARNGRPFKVCQMPTFKEPDEVSC